MNRWFAEKVGIDLDLISVQSVKHRKRRAENDSKRISVEKLTPVDRSRQSLVLRRYVHYLLDERNLTPEMIDEFRISVCRDGPRWLSGSLVFSLRDSKYPGLNSYRRMNGSGYASPGIPSDALFNADSLDGASEPVFVVEGVMDVIRLYPKLAVATFGKDITEDRLDRLAKCEASLVIAMDGDAWETGRAICRRLWLRGKDDVVWVKLPAGYDPADIEVTDNLKQNFQSRRA